MISSFEDTLTSLEETLAVDTAELPKKVDPQSPLELATVHDQAVLLGADPVAISDSRANGDFSHEKLAREYPDLDDYLETLYDAGVPLEEAGRMANAYEARVQATISPREFIFSSALMVEDDTVNPETLRMLTNYERLQARIAARMEESDPSTFRWLSAGGIEFAKEVSTAWITGTLRKNEAKVEEYANTLLLPSEDFDEYWDNELENAESLTIREYENLAEIRRNVDKFGTDYDANFGMFMGLVDAATLGSSALVRNSLLAAGKGAVKAGVKGAVSARDTVSKVLSAKSSSEVVTAVRGEVAGAEATVQQLNSKGTPNSAVLHAGPDTFNPSNSVNVPHSATVQEGTRVSMIFDAMVAAMRSPVTGSTFSRQNLTEAAAEIGERVASMTTNASVKMSRLATGESDTFVYSVLIGKSDTGAAFTTKAAAMKAVKGDVRYTPVRRNAEEVEGTYGLKEEKSGWYLEYKEQVNTKALGDAIEDVNLQEGVFKRAVAGLFSAPQTALGPRLGFMLNAAEGLVAKVNKLATKEFKVLNKLNKTEKEGLNKVFTSYRDKPLNDTHQGKAAQREAPSSEQFALDYFEVTQTVPTENTMKAYRALIDFNNAAWNVRATEILKDVISRGGRLVTVDEGYDTVGVVAKVAEDDVVYSRLQGSIKGSKVGDRIVYRLDEPYDAGNGKFYEFVTDVTDSRIPQKSDVLGYNVGGPRNNETVLSFIGTQYEETLVGGKKAGKGFRTLIGSYSRKEADKAVDELNAIVAVLKPIMKRTGLKTIKDLGLAGDELVNVNAVIARSNSWNPSIENFADLQKMAAKHKETFTTDFVRRGRDQKVTEELPFGSTMTAGEYQSYRVARKRGDTPLMNYGGERVMNQDPIQNIVEQFKSSAYRYTHYKATQASINGWVAKARRKGNVTFENGAIPVTNEDFLRTAKVSGNSPVDLEMTQQQRAIQNRMGLMERTDKENNYYSALAQQIYDKGVFGVGKGLTTKPEDWLGGAAGKARAFTFHLKMGFGNPAQMVLNASHVAQIAAISPIHGLKVQAVVPIIATLMLKTESAILKDIDKLFEAGFAGMTKQEMIDTVKYMKQSGRDIVGTSVLERSGDTFDTATSKAGELLELGLTPYKLGELYGRVAAAATAVSEHSAKRISDDVFSEAGIQWVANREQVLTFRMTSGQKGAYQEGAVLGLATQWMSYTNRFVDNVLIGRDLTGAERARMVAVNTVMFGTRGMGFTPKWTAALVALGKNPEDPDVAQTLNNVKFGFFDYLLSELVGTDISLGTRISPLGGLVQQYQDIFAEDPLYSSLGGPFAQISADTFTSIKGLVSATMGGHKQIAEEELKALTRGIASADMYFKIVELVETGQYRSKRRGIAGEFSEEERSNLGMVALMTAGATPMRVLNNYDTKDISYSEDSKFRDARSRINRYADQGITLILTGEPAKIKEGKEMYNDALNLIEDGGFSRENQHKLRSSIISMEKTVDLIKKTIGQSDAAKITAQAAQGE